MYGVGNWPPAVARKIQCIVPLCAVGPLRRHAEKLPSAQGTQRFMR